MPATREELIDRARALAPAIRGRAAQTAEQRRPHDDSIRDLIEAEIIQMLVPRRFGGSEVSLSTLFDVVEIISAACPSTGWIASFYVAHNTYVVRFPEETQEELLGPRGYVLLPAAQAADMHAVKVPGGWEVSGRAAWGSGIMHADWVQISGQAEDGRRSFLLPVSAVEVIDNWHYAGMAGTGSNDYQACKVFVPDRHAVDAVAFHAGVTEGSKLHPNPLYSIPFLISAYCTILPVLTGSLKGALEAFGQGVERRVRNFGGAVVRDQQMAHVTLGEMEIASLVASDLARTVFDAAEATMGVRDFTLDDRVAAKGKTAYVSKLCRDTVNAMMASAGASSYHLDQPLQRIWRDLNTVCSHAFWDWDVSREAAGRQRLGLPQVNPLV
ncbi:acyl-CoA dehydrogenase family protein [Novosphingobium sp.]|uniref:acyl-CoA dehydrogenase family protein n=1 Tax=Novosphingobium sp. TaxID=1874826 RepID=UPI0035B348AB